MKSGEKSRDSLSNIERLFPQTLSRIPALQRQATLTTFYNDYRQQAPIFLVSVLGLMLIAVTGIAVGKLTPFAAVVPLLLAAGIVLGLGFSYMALWVLLASVTLEKFSFFLLSSGKINVRIDEILAIAIAIGLGLRLVQHHELRKRLSRIPGLILLVIFFVDNILTTLFNHHHLQKGITFLFIISAGIVLYATLALLIGEMKRAEQPSNVLIMVGTLENAFGLTMFCIAYYFWLPGIFGVQIEPASGLLEASGSMFEGNLLGHFSGAILVFIIGISLSLVFYGKLRSQIGLLLLGAGVIALVTLTVTFSRGGWLSAIIGLVVVLVFTLAALDSQTLAQSRQRLTLLIVGAKDQSQQRLIRTVIASCVFALIALVAVVGIAHTTIGKRVTDAFQTQSGSGVARVQDAKGVISEWQQNPVFGLGNGSTDQSPDAANAPPWILSMGLEILHDSGIVGVLLFLWFLWAVYRQLWLSARRARDAELQGLIIGTTGAVTCILVGAQLTNSMYLMLPWAFLGLAGAMPLLTRRINGQADATQLSRGT